MNVFIYILFLATLFIPPLTFAQTESAQYNFSQESNFSGSNIEEFRRELQKAREEVQEQQAKAREEFEEARAQQREEFERRRQEFKEGLKEFRDQTRAIIAEQINEALYQVNIAMTDHWMRQLDIMSDILTELELRVEEAGTAGRDVAKAQGAVDNARSAIEKGRVAVENQAAKTYVVEVTSEQAIGQDLKRVRNLMQNDLKEVQAALKEAKEALQNLVKVINETLGSFTESEVQEDVQ